MSRVVIPVGSARGLCVLALLCSAALPLPKAWAQTVGAQSFGLAVKTATVNTTSPLAVLPAGGGLASNGAPSVSVAGLAGAEDLFAIATGAADQAPASKRDVSAESNSTAENVNLLNGLITADGVVALASSSVTGTGVSSDAEGSQLANLVVNGVAIASDVAPNTQLDLPGVGYVILNEQRRTGDGVTTSGITVNMIHVVLQQPILGLLGQVIGYQTVGEIVVGSATSQVN